MGYETLRRRIKTNTTIIYILYIRCKYTFLQAKKKRSLMEQLDKEYTVSFTFGSKRYFGTLDFGTVNLKLYNSYYKHSCRHD